MYSEKVMDHFTNPRNVGEMPDANAVGRVGNPVCGDIMQIYLKIEDGVVSGYKKIEEGAVDGFNKVTDKIIEKAFAKEGETVEDAKKRLSGDQ